MYLNVSPVNVISMSRTINASDYRQAWYEEPLTQTPDL